ncbi:palmitoyltransferase ZDHHC1-like [Dreissena polymorpha]|nr:palmitoyltransferase ZDHHC1-like [Dreissena polymorpha]
MADIEALTEPSRKNGCTLPPHITQVIAWVVLVVFGVLHFTSLVPALHNSWQPAAHAVPGVVIFVHLIVHVATLTIDPCDDKVLQAKLPKVKLNRAKHSFVIEDGHCNVCQVDVGYYKDSKIRHCRECNKCVKNFDHHCPWLNTCIGAKNYRWYIATLATALVALVLVTGITVMEFITYFTDKNDRNILQPYRDLNATLHYKDADFQILCQRVPHEAWLAMLAVLFTLGVVAVGLITHLLGFHIYLIYHKLTTYAFITAERPKKSQTKLNKNTTSCYIKKGKVNPSNNKDSSFNNTVQGTCLPSFNFLRFIKRGNRSNVKIQPTSASAIPAENNNSKLVMDNELNGATLFMVDETAMRFTANSSFQNSVL